MQKSYFAVKVEPNTVIRGTAFPPVEMSLSEKAQKLFETNVNAMVLSLADLYGGKICAALDRQHPRDLFDVHLLLENEGLTDKIRKAFIVYLVSHPRPMVELLNPTFQDLKTVHENEFSGMAIDKVSLDALLKTREKLVKTIMQDLTENERKFIRSVKLMKPDWQLLGLNSIEDLPAVKWKLQNLGKMQKAKHRQAVEKLRAYLEI